MSYLKIMLFVWFSLLHSFISQGQTEVMLQSDLYFLKLPNGLNAVVKSDSRNPSINIAFYVRLGTVYEQDSFAGISNVLHRIYQNKILRHLSGKNPINLKNCTFESYYNTEQTIYKFTINPSQVRNCFNLMVDSVYNADIKFTELKVALEGVKEEMTQPLSVRQYMDSLILRKLYRTEFNRIYTRGAAASLDNFTMSAIKKHIDKFYKTDNSICTISGNVITSSLFRDFEESFARAFKGNYDPESITKIIDIKPMIYSTQIVVEDEVDNPELEICWQLPGAYSNQKYGHKAYLLSSILNDRNNYIQVKAAKLGCKKLQFQYEANNFSSVLRVVIAPDKNNLISTYQMVLNEMLRVDKMLINESMLNAGKLLFKKEFEAIKATATYPEWVAKFWPYNDDNFFITLADSIANVEIQDMKKFAHEYLYEYSHVSTLHINKADRTDLRTDSLFTDLNDTIMNYQFTYRPNVNELEGEENSAKLYKLLQWLKINTDVQVQINGYSDRTEFNKVKDDSVLAFIDSMPTFRKAMPDVIKKKNMRPDVLRAMRIVKYLYDNGISVERIKGNGMTFSSSNRNEALSNMKCTVTLEKLRDRVSLSEYYGRR